MEDLDLGATIRGFSPGQKAFNRYTLRKILGRGGMGVVWLARDEELEIDVALKFLPEIVALDKESVAELKRETRRNLGLTHPHIVRVHDFVQGPTTAAISMEFVDGASLSALKLDQPGNVFSIEQLLPWTEQLCGALDYAHRSAKIVHRDLKPANLMINAQGELKITDFGIARSVADSVSRVSKEAGSSGTPLYMSPQQMMGEDPAVTDDIYSLGATLYELLTGKPPFHTGNIIAQVQGKVAPRVNERRSALEPKLPPVPTVWDDVLAAALAKERTARPQSAKEFWQRLHGATAPAIIVQPAEPAPAKSPTAKTDADGAPTVAPGKPPALLYGGIALAAVLLLGAGYYFGVHGPAQEREKAEQARLAEAARQAEQQRQAAAARRTAEQAAIAEAKRAAEQAEQARQTEALRVAAEERRQAEARREAEAADLARAAALTEARGRLRTFVQSGSPAKFAEFERGLAELLVRLDPDRRRTIGNELDQARRESFDLTKRIQLALINARSAWLEVKRVADLTRQKAGGTTSVQEDMRSYFRGVMGEAERVLAYKDKPTGREFSLLREGFYSPGLANGNEDTALLVVYGGPGMRLSIDNAGPQDYVAVWDNLPAGSHRLTVEQAGQSPVTVPVVLKKGELLFLPSIEAAVASSARNAGASGAGAAVEDAPADVVDISALGPRGQAPVARVKTPPVYPAAMQRADISGYVVVQFVVSTSGDIVSAVVLQSSHQGFEAAALQAVRKWKFQPGRIDGQTVNVRMQQKLVFKLEDQPAR
jgi:TonB family protein